MRVQARVLLGKVLNWKQWGSLSFWEGKSETDGESSQMNGLALSKNAQHGRQCRENSMYSVFKALPGLFG